MLESPRKKDLVSTGDSGPLLVYESLVSLRRALGLEPAAVLPYPDIDVFRPLTVPLPAFSFVVFCCGLIGELTEVEKSYNHSQIAKIRLGKAQKGSIPAFHPLLGPSNRMDPPRFRSSNRLLVQDSDLCCLPDSINSHSRSLLLKDPMNPRTRPLSFGQG